MRRWISKSPGIDLWRQETCEPLRPMAAEALANDFTDLNIARGDNVPSRL